MPSFAPTTCFLLFALIYTARSFPSDEWSESTSPCPFASREQQAADSPCPFAAVDASSSASDWSPAPTFSAAPNPGQKTVSGCDCTSTCGAGISDGFKCDWCYTTQGCGKSGSFFASSKEANWDYCVYPGNITFEAQTAAQKSEYFWGRITEDPTSAPYISPAFAFAESIQTTFSDFAFRDEMPANRKKVIHGQGSICQFDLVVSASSPYTGLFAPGKQTGFVRMGSALVPTPTAGLVPGLGIKFPRTGVHSGNYVALHALSPQDGGKNFNFFQNPLSNHIRAPGAKPQPFATLAQNKLLVKKFDQATQCPTFVGLSDMAKYAQDGTEVAAPKFPFKLFMVPGSAVQQPIDWSTMAEIMARMGQIPVGTTLYSVYACGKASANEMTPNSVGLEGCGDPVLLGDMKTSSECTTSNYGDSKYFIRHQMVESDWKLNPDYITAVNGFDVTTACGASTPVTADGFSGDKCPNYRHQAPDW